VTTFYTYPEPTPTDADIGEGGDGTRRRFEASAQRVEIGQPAGIEIGVERGSQLGFAGALVGQREQCDHGATRGAGAR
jgi:hypothetical protein